MNGIIIAVLFVLECGLVTYYLRQIKKGVNVKTLLLKISCSAVFIITGIVCAAGAGNFHTLYATLMLAGFFCSLIGDGMLHLNPKTPQIILGGVGFLAAHVLYIIAFIKTEAALTGGAEIISARDVFAIAGVYVLAVILYFSFRLKAGKLLVPVMIYALALSFMFSKAFDMGYALIESGTAAGIIPVAGALLFVFSDFMLGIGFLGKPAYNKQVLNISSYYTAQMLLALSIFFIK